MEFSFRLGTQWCHDFPKLAKESGFHFNMHKSRTKINWNRIGSIDIDQVIQDADFLTVDENVDTVIDYCLEDDPNAKVLNCNFVKLFRLAQLAVEYLLYCKQYLDHSVVILKDELKSKIEDNCRLKKEILILEDTVKKIKETAKEKIRSIEAKINDSHGEIHKCSHCRKIFSSSIYLTSHIERRHPYSVNLLSPTNEQYRVETEKLNDEIKNLKERLNETEKVLRNDSIHSTGNDKKFDRQETHVYKELQQAKNFRYNREEQQNFRGSNEKLTSMNQSEIDPNVKVLIVEQEKEIERLRNELRERLTPDIENMQSKLHTQETYWKSKLEDLENQYHKDIQNLKLELKSTQQETQQMKDEYNSKVNELEIKSLNHSRLLSEQLHSLSQGIHNSWIKSGDNENIQNNADSLQHSLIKSPYQLMVQQERKKTVERIDINHAHNPGHDLFNLVSPYEREFRSKSEINGSKYDSSNAFDQKMNQSIYSTFTELKKTQHNRYSQTKPEDEVEKSGNKDFMHIRTNKKHKNHQKGNHDHLKNGIQENDVHDKQKISKLSLEMYKDNSKLTKIDTADLQLSDHHLNTESENTIDSENESVSSSSESISDSNTLDQCPPESKIISNAKEQNPKGIINKLKNIKNNKTMTISQLKESVRESFHKKLKDLGLDPFWDGIPDKTFEQKLKIVNHHKKINSKKLPKYLQLKKKILKELHKKISTNDKHKSKSVNQGQITVQSSENTTKNTVLDEETNYSYDYSDTEESVELTTDQKLTRTKMINHEDKIEEILSDIPAEGKGRRKTSLLLSPQSFITKDSNIFQETNSMQYNATSTPNENNQPLHNISSGHELFSQNQIISPKNRSVLKTTSGSTSSLAKKKVIFDLQDKYDADEDFDKSKNSEGANNKQLDDSDWDISSVYEDKIMSENLKKQSFDNIKLKTVQSDKIKKLSEKIEEQLHTSRKKPVGAVETIMVASNNQNQNNNDDNIQLDSASITSSILETSSLELPVTEINNSKFPQPAPRTQKQIKPFSVRNQSVSNMKDIDLEDDINSLLKIVS